MSPRIAFYGDDFTGSTDVMEVLQWSGLRTILFLQVPNLKQRESFGNYDAIGLAGHSRSMSPDEMELELRAAFHWLRELKADLVHYKTCSTFDSSPEVGSVGRAMELGREVLGGTVVPMVIAAPNLGRYQAFGNLFARSGLDSELYRLDRHPTMQHHPITPMDEADIRVHLKRQTDMRVELCDLLQLNAWSVEESSDCLMQASSDALLFDVLDSSHLVKVGAMLDRFSRRAPGQLVVGSSGVESSLTKYWQTNQTNPTDADGSQQLPVAQPCDQILALTGSCSPVNERQLAWAERNGFVLQAIDVARLLDSRNGSAEIEQAIDSAVATLKSGASLILHTSRGPNDPRIKAALQMLEQHQGNHQVARLSSAKKLGPLLGNILRGVLASRRVSRVAFAGGDTSGYIAQELNIVALEAIAPVTPGAPLCRVHAENGIDGIEVLFKGGQVGKDDVWRTILHGRPIG